MDTQKITRDLLESGLTQQELADLVPCGQSTIAAYLAGTRGARLSKAIGDRLEALHAERCKPEPPALDPRAAPDRPFRQPPNADKLMSYGK